MNELRELGEFMLRAAADTPIAPIGNRMTEKRPQAIPESHGNPGKEQELRCSTCLWFERDGDKPHGLCLVDPPVLQVVMPPPNPVTGKVQPAIQGLRPPTGESNRCHKHATRTGHDQGHRRADHVGAGTDRDAHRVVADQHHQRAVD